MRKDDLKKLKELLGDDGKFIEIEVHCYDDGITLEVTKLQRDFEYSSNYMYHLEEVFSFEDNLDSKYFRAIKNFFPFVEKAFVWADTMTSDEWHQSKGDKMLKYLDNCKNGIYDEDCSYIIKIPKNFKLDKLDESKIDDCTLYINSTPTIRLMPSEDD